MDLEQMFSIANLTAVVGWAALALLPFWRGSQVIAGIIIPLLLSIAYVGLLFPPIIAGGGMDGDFSSLAGVRQLFTSDTALLVGWIHYLAFDLFVGAWEARDAKAQGVPHWLLLPCLVLTFMFGPTGLLLYFIIRTLHTRRVAPLA